MNESLKLWQTATKFEMDHTPTKKGVARAKAKHRNDNVPKPTPPTLADRFHALPSELRSHIFSFLIVQPVKWDISHHPSCLLTRASVNQFPRPPFVLDHETVTCVSCDQPEASRWRRDTTLGLDIWTSPWRSRWAPPQTNPYLCSQCYDNNVRPQPFPSPWGGSLPCLCARRQNLDVLLVCKKWYHEAATVFYTQNTFAFESAVTFTAFVTNLPSHWRDKISKISLMSFSNYYPGEVFIDSADPRAGVDSWRWKQVWPLLRSLPALSTLELDSRFLNNTTTVRALLLPRFRNLRHVSFVDRPKKNPQLESLWKTGTEKIWPSMDCRTLIVGGFAEEVGRIMKGERRTLLKGKRGTQVVAKAVEYGSMPGQGILESSLFEGLGFSKTTARQVLSIDQDGYEEDHFGLLGLHDA